MTNEICGQPTKSGKPCNMPKGHHALFHRHREYPTPISWVIFEFIDPNIFNELERGYGREELSYAMTRCLQKTNNLRIDIHVHNPLNPVG